MSAPTPDSPTPPDAAAPPAGVDVVQDLNAHEACAQFVERVPIDFARRFGVIGLTSDNGRLPVAVAELRSWECMDILRRFLNRPVQPILAPADSIAAKINHAYQQRSGQAQQFIEGLNREQAEHVIEAVAGDGRPEDLLDSSGRAPVIRLVNLIFFEAVKQRASDIHFQPQENRLIVRFRIDGVLFDAHELPRALQEEIASRIKVMGRMDIAEKRLAQDGRTSVQVGDRLVDLRISTIPTSFGERTVIRLLDKSQRLYRLDELGMDPHTLAGYRKLIGVEHGLLLVTGPTGSGKSTTLYGALQQINAKDKNILTLEDPIEYQLEGISQTQVSGKKGMTFASGLRNVLRQDPDIIMVGEIRDHETAVMAIQSALTGHMVFSTLHTNDASSAVTRLLDLNIEPYLVSSSLVGVLAQRLVRRICDHCARPHEPTAAEMAILGKEAEGKSVEAMRVGEGCDRCRGTGYAGRVGIFELLGIDDAVRHLIQDRATASAIKHAAVAAGMRTLHADGVAKALAGRTTIEEVERVTSRQAS